MDTSVPPPRLHLYSLPNEVFVQILSPFSTRDLLPLAAVSHRFHALVLRILHYRLLLTASLKEFKLILECFHPSSKLAEPHVFCRYLGTDGLSDQHDGEGSRYEDADASQRLGRLASLYSRFRPEVTVEERASGAQLVPLMAECRDDMVVTRPVDFEDYEDFSQLCVVVNVVKVMPGTNLLLSIITIVDGVVRLFRDWLGEQERKGRDAAATAAATATPANDDQMLWVDADKNVGLKLRVREKTIHNRQFPILMHRDDLPCPSYEIDVQELHVRTTRLLLAVEKSQEELQEHQRAMIFTQRSI
ncbi:F-box protein [Aspergillus clavatus NRRL 1]|uniref:F-box domain protein n=1 Tax=Aspergillus clavatus (strain ATCC 1007 / CBS 513.65 / DSM 816 / NCTC 3887 / NRRL 1 / QM 1276 / 107) TaxID=344612 RepID=A1C6J5_ASPCL|nr:F-box domain protein [Aspergillus clavatus NRRL 1]EAW14016.1 F-box domain protein [Aspergillus clavatus NRRL 1]